MSDLGHIAELTPLLRQLNGLKRVRSAQLRLFRRQPSRVDHTFARAWWRLLDQEDADRVALSETAELITGVTLGPATPDAFARFALQPYHVKEIATAAFNEVADAIAPDLRGRLRATFDFPLNAIETLSPIIDGVEPLLAQPRAGATHPTQPRLFLEPAESHGDHCGMVAAYGVLLSPHFDADPTTAFMIGLAHHLFNVHLPDLGFAGDRVLAKSGHHERVMDEAWRLGFAGIEKVNPNLANRVREALTHTKRTDTPEAKTFHAADVIDRTLEMAWHAEAAGFTLADAMGRMNIVHEAPEQALQREVLEAAGIWNDWSNSATGETV